MCSEVISDSSCVGILPFAQTLGLSQFCLIFQIPNAFCKLVLQATTRLLVQKYFREQFLHVTLPYLAEQDEILFGIIFIKRASVT